MTRKAWRRTARAADRLGRSSPDAALHEVRKRAKRARYAAELGRDVFGKRATRLAERLTDVQDGLGEVQDTVVAEERLRALRLPSDSAFVAGMLVCGERSARERMRVIAGPASGRLLARSVYDAGSRDALRVFRPSPARDLIG